MRRRRPTVTTAQRPTQQIAVADIRQLQWHRRWLAHHQVH